MAVKVIPIEDYAPGMEVEGGVVVTDALEIIAFVPSFGLYEEVRIKRGYQEHPNIYYDLDALLKFMADKESYLVIKLSDQKEGGK